MSWQFFVIVLAVAQISAYSLTPEEPKVIAKYRDNSETDNVVNGQNRILSGWDARPGQHPHHANLRIVDHWGNGFGCGGSIISRDWVVSAAHCTTTHAFVQVRAGMVRVVEATYVVESREWYNHPTWNPNVNAVQPNDISIIRLPIPVVFTSLLRAIRMPPVAEANRDYSGRQLVASGHGRIWTNGAVPETLQWVYLRGVTNNDCFRVFGTLITANTVCAQYFNVTSQSTCQGDSGGPLVDTINGVPYLMGIASFVAGGDQFGCHSGFPAGFCRTAPFQPWFSMITGEDFENIEVDTEPPPTEIPTTTESWNTTTESWNTTTSAPWNTTTESWNTTTESWNTTTSAPWNTTTESWNTTTSAPWNTTTESWNTTTSAPWNTTTESWNTTTSAPWNTTTESWNTTTSAPWNTTTESWNTTTSAPWNTTTESWNTTTSAPWNTTTESWNTTTSAPWNTTTEWWNTTTSAPWNTTTESWNTTTSAPWNTTTEWTSPVTEPWNTTTTEGTTTPSPDEDGDGDEDDSSSEEDDDCDFAQLLKKLQIKVKVKVQLNKYGKKVIHEHEHKKAISHPR